MRGDQAIIKPAASRIGMVSTYGVKCGIATYTKYLCEALDKQGVSTEVLAEKPYPESSLDKDFSSSIPFRPNWNRKKPYFDLIQDSKEYDILHIQHQFSLFPDEYTLAQLMYQAKRPIVLTMHDVLTPNPQLKKYFHTLFMADRLIVHTKTCFDLLKTWNVDESKVSVIPIGSPAMPLLGKSQTRRELGFAEDAEIIMSWGFIHESKGVLELILTLAEILRIRSKAVLVHVGGIHPAVTNNYLMQILQTAVNHNIPKEQFHITQWVPRRDVPKWFAISDLIVLNHARDYACASGSAHEALAAHRPIIKTDDACLEGIPGYQVPRLSRVALCKGICHVLEDKNLQRELVKTADKASQKMSWGAVAKQHKRLYELI